MGNLAATNVQGQSAVAIGDTAAAQYQGTNAIAIGYQAGYQTQGSGAVAIGYQAGQTLQGGYSVAIGYLAGSTAQGANSIVINATGSILNNTVASSFVIKPIRTTATAAQTGMMFWNSTTGEVQSITTSKTFVIDHPIKKENYLVHACLEGPEAGVYYRGEGVIIEGLDTVVIKLPDYTSSWYDFTINVTPIGKPVNLGVSRVKNCSFCVYGQPCGFFWTVYGKRCSIEVEPRKESVTIKGEGPYRWIN